MLKDKMILHLSQLGEGRVFVLLHHDLELLAGEVSTVHGQQSLND